MKKYKQIGLLVVVLLLLSPIAFAKDININNVPISVKWSITKDGEKMIWVNITVWSDDDKDDFRFTKNISNQTSDNDNDFEIDITRDLDCDSGSDIAKDLVTSTYAIATTLNNSFNIPKEFVNCLEGRAQIAAHNERYKDELGQCQNKSTTFEGLYTTETSKKGDIQSRLDTCNRDLLETNTGKNTCTTELEQTKKKPIQYAMVSILITLIALNMYNKSKEPKPPEVFQFPER